MELLVSSLPVSPLLSSEPNRVESSPRSRGATRHNSCSNVWLRLAALELFQLPRADSRSLKPLVGTSVFFSFRFPLFFRAKALRNHRRDHAAPHNHFHVPTLRVSGRLPASGKTYAPPACWVPFLLICQKWARTVSKSLRCRSSASDRESQRNDLLVALPGTHWCFY